MLVRFADHDRLLEQIMRHASADLQREVAGVIVGEVAGETEDLELTVVGAIPAQNTSSALAHVTFTHESWNSVHAEVERLFPEQKIVGWYHSHPDFGIFLSSHDEFICRNFFNLPWQVAIVVDPIRKEEGMFVWQDQRLVKVPVQDGPVSLERKAAVSPSEGAAGAIDLELDDLDEADTAGIAPLGEMPTSGRTEHILPTSMIVLLLIVLALLALSVFQTTRLSAVSEDLRDLQTNSESLRVAQQALDDRVSSLPDSESLSSVEARVAKAEKTLATLPAVSPSSATTTGVSSSPTTAPAVPSSSATLYTVKAGDTLWDISNRFYGGPGFVPMIAAVNGLRNADMLLTGTKLVLLKIDGMER